MENPNAVPTTVAQKDRAVYDLLQADGNSEPMARKLIALADKGHQGAREYIAILVGG